MDRSAHSGVLNGEDLANGRNDPFRLDEWRYRRGAPQVGLTVPPGTGHEANTHAPAAFTDAQLDSLTQLRQRAAATA